MAFQISDHDIQALVDNELGWEEEKLLRQYFSSHPKAHKRYQDLMRQKRLLKAYWEKIERHRH